MTHGKSKEEFAHIHDCLGTSLTSSNFEETSINDGAYYVVLFSGQMTIGRFLFFEEKALE